LCRKKLAQRRRGAKGRKSSDRFNQRNALPKAPPILFHLHHFSLLLIFSCPFFLCAFASLRETILLQAVHASFFQPVDAADDAVFHQRGTDVHLIALL
jgi:hypothetical protein